MLVVKERKAGPVIYAKWRVPTEGGGPAEQVMKVVGPGWLVRAGEAGGKPNGRTIGAWRERAGRAPEGYLTPRDADRRADEVVAKWEAERAQEEAASARPEGATLRDAADRWLADGEAGALTRQDGDAWKYSTASNYRDIAGRICRELGDVRLERVTEHMLRDFLDGLRPERNGRALDRPPSRRMRAAYVVVARAILARAAEIGWVGESPAAGLRAPKQRRRQDAAALRRDEYFEADELRAVVAEARLGYRHARNPPRSAARLAVLRRQSDTDAAMVLTMGMLGLRLGEAVALRWEDVDLAASKIVVRRNRTRGRYGTPKSGLGRVIPMAPEVAAELARLGLRGYATDPTDLVFVGQRGEHVDVPRFRARYYSAQDRTGIAPRRTVHQLRHSFGVALARHGVPLATISKFLGHGSVAVTEIYSAFVPGDREAAMVSAAFASEPATT